MSPPANDRTQLLPLNKKHKLERTLSGAGAADTAWFKISFVIIANFLGTGVLSLPYATASLGWVFAYVALIVCTLGALFSGVLFSRLNERFPEARVYADVAREAWGPRGDTLVRACSYTYMGGVLVAFHLTCTIALEQTFYTSGVCAPYWSLLVAIVLLVLAQIRSLNEVGSLAIIGSIAIIVPIVLVCESVLQDSLSSQTFNTSMPSGTSLSNNSSGATRPPSPFFPENPQFVPIGVALTNMVFAFAGQVIFIELQAEMENPQHFVKAMSTATLTMTVTYAIMMFFGYYYLGVSAPAPITSALSGGIKLRIVNGVLLLHVIIAYAIEVNVLTRAMVNIIAPEDTYSVNWSSRVRWFWISFAFIAFAFTASNGVPFFNDIMGFLAAALSISLTYIFPALLALKLAELAPWERMLCNFVVPTSIIVAIVGTVCVIIDTVERFKTSAPFSCKV